MPKVLDLPEVHVGRCKFPRQFRQITTFNVGDLIPLMVDCNITPGDVVKIPIKALLRMQTPLYPVLDDLVFDVTAWFVPDRITWKHFVNFWGENDTTFWEEPTTYEIPQIESPTTTGWAEGSLADYFGIPTKVPGLSVSQMPFRAYCKVWNDYFRDENLKEPIFYNEDETTLTGINYAAATYDYTTDTQLGAKPMKVAKRSDYFTKSLPEPQKMGDVMIPLGADGTLSGSAPVIGNGENPYLVDAQNTESKIQVTTADNHTVVGFNSGSVHNNSLIKFSTDPEKSGLTTDLTNVSVDLSTAAGISVNTLRNCIALQRYSETIARSGSRYIELLAGIFGVKSSDARLQRAEYLGGQSYPISMSQVVAQTAATNQKMGNVGGMSQTIINDYLCTKGFEEHGTLLVCGCVRIRQHTYQNGLHRMFTRKAREEFFNRAFDHLGESKVRNDELYAQGSEVVDPVTGRPMDELPFGYQPAYEDMRLGRHIVTGEMRSNATTSLDAWHYADDYNSLPTLSSEWIDEDLRNVDRTLSVTSKAANQLFGDFVFDTEYTRGMSMYGTPGFMDHM